jgi:hypothetical protein
MSRLIAEIGAAALVLGVVVTGPQAARSSGDAFALSRPIGRADEVNRRALVAAVVALVSSLAIGAVGYAWAPALFRSQLAEVSWTSWYNERLNPLYGVDVVLDSAEERTCFDKWYAARWGGSTDCNDSASNGFSGSSGKKTKTFVFASAHERDCLARWRERRPQCFMLYTHMVPEAHGDPDAKYVSTGFAHIELDPNISCLERSREESEDLACAAFASKLAAIPGPIDLFIADNPETQSCFTEWQRAFGTEPVCWAPPEPLTVTIPPIGLLLVVCFGVALFAGAMVRTALAPSGLGRAVVIALVVAVFVAPSLSLMRSRGLDTGTVLGATSALAVSAYVVALWRWTRGDFR